MRDTEAPEDNYMAVHNMRNFTVEEVRKNGAKEVAQSALEYLDKCDVIYVSFDVDSLDSSISMGTGTPVPNGITIEEAKEINCTLVSSPKVCAWELVEINPTLDSENKMAEVAFEILEATTETARKNHKRVVLND
jgi:arginase